MRKLTHEELVARQRMLMASAGRIPLVIVLNNIRSLYNVGSIFRTCDGVGVEKLWLCGITGHPPSNQISKTALGAEESVPWEHSWDVCSVVRNYKQRGYEIVMLEQTESSRSFELYRPEGPVCLIAGNEISGVHEELLELTDQALEIEMVGLKNSLNVTVAVGIVAYHVRNGMKQEPSGMDFGTNQQASK